MESLGLLLIVISVAVGNAPAIMHQWRTDRPGFIKKLWLIGAYALYVALGIAGLLLLLPEAAETKPEPAVLLLAGVIVAWILYGGLTLMRLVPRYREPPRWLMRFGIADVIVLGVLFGCLAGYLSR